MHAPTRVSQIKEQLEVVDEEVENVEIVMTTLMWKLNPGVRIITLTTIANYKCKLLTKETEYGVEH